MYINKVNKYGFRKNKAVKGLAVALLGVTGVLIGPSIEASTLVKSGIQATPFSRVDYNSLTEGQKAEIIEGQITDQPMSWVNEENGQVEWVTEFVLVYKSNGYCELVPNTDVTIPTPSEGTIPVDPSPINTPNPQNIKSSTENELSTTPTKLVQKFLPNTGGSASPWVTITGIGLAALGGYLVFRNKRSGKKMAVAILVAGGLGFSTMAYASELDFLQIVDTIKIELSSNFSHTAPEDKCWEYVGYPWC
ncbi:cell wall surface anchor family protein [Streptococcus acidominimus]|uniref:Cell wall surface anchor family protein n=1 Tax=Streptococcus acidominimus TaxID=1326 RepID=A0A239WL17_STRAI|nr:LPXTG cell wall anchor domain-containing protein [Streptococcus acidominimus]SNV34899.1 cell wall surface anchor family protein [Streptococcus acidominimus]